MKPDVVIHHRYWIVWSVDDREPIIKRGKPHRYYNGKLTRIDPSVRTAFSYIAGWEWPGTTSWPWTYERGSAMAFPSLQAARAFRRAIWLMWRPGNRTPRDNYGITRVNVWRPRFRRTSVVRGTDTKEKTR